MLPMKQKYDACNFLMFYSLFYGHLCLLDNQAEINALFIYIYNYHVDYFEKINILRYLIVCNYKT